MGRINEKQKERLVLAAGLVLRLVYVLFSTIYERQYDISQWDLSQPYAGGGGHLGYIHYLYTYGHLPDMDPVSVYQFSHPPLHYALSAGWLKLASFFIKDPAALAESIQVLPLVCSVLTLYFFVKILDLSGLSGRGRMFTLLLLCVHPSLILLSGSVNNDGLAFLFTVMCVYYLMRWTRDRKTATVVKLALSLGLGMMTKLSVAEMALPCAMVFVYVLIRTMRGGGADAGTGRRGKGAVGEKAAAQKSSAPWKPYPAQAAVFLGISLPVGLWFYLRNYIVWRTPLTFVHDLGTDSWQYIGNVPAVHRYLFPVPAELFDNLRNLRIGCGYNVWVQIMRTSVTGEWDMATVPAAVKALAMLLMLTGFVLALAALVAFVRGCVITPHPPASQAPSPQGEGKSRLPVADVPCPPHGDARCPWDTSPCPPLEGRVAPQEPGEVSAQSFRADRILFVSAYLVHFLLYLRFSYDNPYMCSMDFRYIRILLLFPAVALGFSVNRTKGNPLRIRALWMLLVLFSVFSAAMTFAWAFL